MRVKERLRRKVESRGEGQARRVLDRMSVSRRDIEASNGESERGAGRERVSSGEGQFGCGCQTELEAGTLRIGERVRSG